MSEQFTHYLMELLGQLDYLPIFLLMAAESSILPVPSELVMIPAGYLVSVGKLDPWLVSLCASLGSILGSLASYALALRLGRPFLLRFGKYLLIDERHLDKTEHFFSRHGEISIFSGRFVPGIRHLISMPAGLGRMGLIRFSGYTLFGATLWNTVLLGLGWAIGENQEWFRANLHWIGVGSLLFAGALVAGYVLWQKRKRDRSVDLPAE
jgi:membrane protein DedA with SNARE-associated domain